MSNCKRSKAKYEICIGCGLTTDVLISTPVDSRKNYIHGCGQLCESCANKLEREKRSNLSSAEIAKLMQVGR